ncbi:Coiled-coil domain-containing protein 87 [Chytridiales sp. JEL 0842]|nr:Coiled-coil domain-containing protein 87 [Chytridiales sp. JEL 0842]
MALRSVFDAPELDEDRMLEHAISKAEHRHLVRQQLKKGNHGIDAIQQKQQGIQLLKYGRMLGFLGYDQLALKPLSRVDGVTNDRRTAVKAVTTASHKDLSEKKPKNIPALLKKIVGEIELVGWLNPDERERLFKDALDSVMHPLPQVEPPKISAKDQQIVMRKRLIQESEHEQRTANPLQRTRFFQDGVENSTHVSDSVETQKRHNEVSADLDNILAKNASQKKTSDSDDSNDDSDYSSSDNSNVRSARDDPVLQAHSLKSRYKRRKEVVSFELSPPRKRYLLSSKVRAPHTTGYDFKELERMLPPVIQRIMPKEVRLSDKTIIRSLGSRVSIRVPKGFITLSAEPAAAVSEFGSEVDSKLLDNLDEKLSRFKEVEELYDEIMKTVVGGHLDAEDDTSNSQSCPAAPYDPKIPLSNAFQGISGNIITKSTPDEYDADSEAKKLQAKRVSTPEVRLNTRARSAGVTVSPDEFSTNRAAAMRKTPSSRYNLFKYNFGGYIPYDIDQENKKKKEVFGSDDYLDYLRSRSCDFVMDLLVDREEDQRAMQRALEMQKEIENAEEIKRRKQEEREARQAHIAKLTTFERGLWNAGTLQYISELQQGGFYKSVQDIAETNGSHETSKEEQTVPAEEFDNQPNVDEPDKMLSTSPSEPLDEPHPEENQEDDAPSVEQKPAGEASGPLETNVDLSQEAETYLLQNDKKRVLVRTDSTLDIAQAQTELENLWITLKMPLDQKMDMAIKYGSFKFAPKLEKAINLWKTASDYIIDRENLLIDIESFEIIASKPERFFQKGYDGSSEARLKEAKKRDEFLSRLHYLEARITNVISMIRTELTETVTYKGIPYGEKMKTDYLVLIKRVQKL